MRLAAVALALALAAQSAISNQSTINSQQSAIPPQQETIPARLVTIDLIATDVRGRTVDDLKPADFELREEGTPLALESVRLVRVAAAVPGDAPIAIQTAAEERQAASLDEPARTFRSSIAILCSPRPANFGSIRPVSTSGFLAGRY